MDASVFLLLFQLILRCNSTSYCLVCVQQVDDLHMSISESDCKGLELGNLTILGPYTVHQFTNWCFLVLYVYCILCEPLCQLKYNGNTTNFHSVFAEPGSMCLCCFVLISAYLPELQYLKYICDTKV